MSLLFKPFAIAGAIAGARLGRSIFRGLWAKLDGAEPPRPTSPEASLSKVILAAMLEGATTAAVAAAADRATIRVFYYLTGIWPGKQVEK